MNNQVFSKKYQVKREIARGGMGTIYLATDTKLGRDVAIKMLHPQYSGEPAFAQRFLREARAMAKLDHPNIIRIWSVEEEEGSHCIVMEYFPGNDLKQIIRSRGHLPITEALSLMTQIIKGLGYAHSMGIIHRDIKPANILVDQEGKVKITDFGIAAAFNESSLTVDGMVIGTPEYMAPEQARAEPVGPHTDLYSAGILLYELLTGQTPYKGIPAQTLIAKLAFDSINPPLSFPPNIPGELQDLITKMTQKQVEHRLIDTKEFLNLIKSSQSTIHSLQPNTAATALLNHETASKISVSSSHQPVGQDQSSLTKNQPANLSSDPSKFLETRKNRKLIFGAIGILVFAATIMFVLSQWKAIDLPTTTTLKQNEDIQQPNNQKRVETTVEIAGKSKPSNPAHDIQTQLTKKEKVIAQDTQEQAVNEQQIEDLTQQATQLTTSIQEFRSQTFAHYQQLTQQIATYATQIGSPEFHTQNETLADTENLQSSLGDLKESIIQHSAKHNQRLQFFAQSQKEILARENQYTQSPLPSSLQLQLSDVRQTLKSINQDLQNLQQVSWKELEANIDTTLLALKQTKETFQQTKAREAEIFQSSSEITALKRILDDFTTDYKNRDILKLKLSTSMSESRTRNLDLMFKIYTGIDMHIEILSTSETQANAKIFIDQLINKEGKTITPNFIIRETAITIPKKDGEWGKIQW